MFTQRRLESQFDLDNLCLTPSNINTKHRKSHIILNNMKENIPPLNTVKNNKNGLISYSYSQKVLLQTKPKLNNKLVKSPNINSNYRILSLPLNEGKENEIMNRPLPSYKDRYLSEIQVKSNQREDANVQIINNSPSNQQQNLACVSPLYYKSQLRETNLVSPVPRQLNDKSPFVLKTPQNSLKPSQNNYFEQINQKTTNGFYQQKFSIKNKSKYNNFLMPSNHEVSIKVPSCPVLIDEAEFDCSPQIKTYTPNNKRITCQRSRLIFKKYMDNSGEISQNSPDLLTANLKKQNLQLATLNTSAEKQLQEINNSVEKSQDFSHLKKYYGQKYEPKLQVKQQLQQQQSNRQLSIKSKKLQMILSQRNNTQVINNQTTNAYLGDYEMKPWDQKSETFLTEEADTSLIDILNQLSK
ncbi:hypothetical protein ABPG74_014358 [Tetrahymena malaccensis]